MPEMPQKAAPGAAASRPVTVRIYTKAQCSLCEVARRALADIGTRVSFTLEVVDIRGSADTWVRYRHAVPVIEVDGREVARLRIDAVGLERELVAAAGR